MLYWKNTSLQIDGIWNGKHVIAYHWTQCTSMGEAGAPRADCDPARMSHRLKCASYLTLSVLLLQLLLLLPRHALCSVFHGVAGCKGFASFLKNVTSIISSGADLFCACAVRTSHTKDRFFHRIWIQICARSQTTCLVDEHLRPIQAMTRAIS